VRGRARFESRFAALAAAYLQAWWKSARRSSKGGWKVQLANWKKAIGGAASSSWGKHECPPLR